MATAVFQIDTLQFEHQALQWAQQFDEICFFQSNGYRDEYTQIDSLLAVKALDAFVPHDTEDTFHALEKFRPGTQINGCLVFLVTILKMKLRI